MDYKKIIRDVPDYPKPGILFKDLTTLWQDSAAFKESIEQLARQYVGKGIRKVVGAESRGFIVGAVAAYILGVGFVPVRKKGKLPAPVISEKYALEYGEAEIEIHKDAIEKGEKVLIVDDLLDRRNLRRDREARRETRRRGRRGGVPGGTRIPQGTREDRSPGIFADKVRVIGNKCASATLGNRSDKLKV